MSSTIITWKDVIVLMCFLIWKSDPYPGRGRYLYEFPQMQLGGGANLVVFVPDYDAGALNSWMGLFIFV